jgi:hypothetical protein
MLISPRYRGWSLGTPEYILLKAGLFQADDQAVSPTAQLTRLLRPLKDVPDDLLPILVQMAECAAIEVGGALDTGARRSPVIAGLRKLGLRHESIGDLFVLVGKGAAEAAKERRNRPGPEALYM